MGVSTDGILCYGICLPEEEELTWLKAKGEEEDKGEKDEEGEYEEGETLDFEDFIVKLEGLKEPTTDYNTDEKGWRKYWDAKERLQDKVGIDLVYHCSSDYPMHILAIRESVHNASRGNPEKLGKEIKGQPKEWDARLKAFCKRVGIEYEDPEWILCSDWG